MASQIQNYNALKRKYPKMADSEVMKKAMALTAESRTKMRKADKKASKKLNWVEKLKMGVTKRLASKRHSPAGRKHLKNKKGY